MYEELRDHAIPASVPTPPPPPVVMAPVSFSRRELDIMSILWRRGSGTVAEVRRELEDDLGYTAVLKVLQILEEKGHIRHEKEGRAHRYHPLVDAAEAGESALDRVVEKIFHGSAELALARLVSRRPIRAKELERMRALLDELEAEPAEDRGEEDA